MLLYVARIGGGGENSETAKASRVNNSANNGSIVVLVALDASANAILSFGTIGDDVTWSDSSGKALLSAGFVEPDGRRQEGNSTPQVSAHLAADRDAGVSNYAIDWDLDPGTLANVIDRGNATIPSTANLPKLLKVAIFYNVDFLPFDKNNFGTTTTNLWSHGDWGHEDIVFRSNDLSNMTLTIEVNGFEDMKYSYALSKMYKLNLIDRRFNDPIVTHTRCTILEFKGT